jgi:hypothetical protein
MIHRLFEHPAEQYSKRYFCGFCGSSLSYWCEQPRSEAEFIRLPLRTLCAEDLSDLRELGLMPDSDDEVEKAGAGARTDSAVRQGNEEVVVYRGRETLGVPPWFDSLVEGSMLGRLRAAKGSKQSRDGSVRVEWEVVEWTEDDGHDTSRSGKRKLDERGDSAGEPTPMEGIQH